jgi:hypothetical protein
MRKERLKSPAATVCRGEHHRSHGVHTRLLENQISRNERR